LRYWVFPKAYFCNDFRYSVPIIPVVRRPALFSLFRSAFIRAPKQVAFKHKDQIERDANSPFPQFHQICEVAACGQFAHRIVANSGNFSHPESAPLSRLNNLHKEQMLFSIVIASSVAGALAATNTKTDGIALTPPMGWNSWNAFKCDITEQDVRTAADELAALGTFSPHQIWTPFCRY